MRKTRYTFVIDKRKHGIVNGFSLWNRVEIPDIGEIYLADSRDSVEVTGGSPRTGGQTPTQEVRRVVDVLGAIN